MNWHNQPADLKPSAVAYRHRCQPELHTEFVGEGIVALAGYQVEDFTRGRLHSLLDIVYPQDVERVQKALLTPSTTPTGEVYRLEYRIVTKEGRIRHIYDRGRRIFQNGRGAWLTGVLFDLTAEDAADESVNLETPLHPRLSQPSSTNPLEPTMQRLLKQLHTLQQHLQQSNNELAIAHLSLAVQQQRYQDLFNFAPDGYLVTGPTGIIHEANQTIAQLLQVEQQQLLGQSFPTFVAPNQQAEFHQEWQQLLGGAESRHIGTGNLGNIGNVVSNRSTLEVTLRSPANVEFPAELSMGVVENGQSEIIGIRLLVRNIAQRKQLEVQHLQSNAKLQQQVVAQATALKQAARKLEKLALVDHLTKVANRRRFDEHLQQEWRRLQRQAAPLTLIMCDVDNFKRYNDLYGHPAGDTCLQQVAQVLRQALRRSGDLVARYGGEEFAVILPDTHTAGAIHLVEKMRTHIATLQLVNGDDPLTLSFGLTTVIPERQHSIYKLISAADQALYYAKHSGRNRYAVRHLEDIE